MKDMEEVHIPELVGKTFTMPIDDKDLAYVEETLKHAPKDPRLASEIGDEEADVESGERDKNARNDRKGDSGKSLESAAGTNKAVSTRKKLQVGSKKQPAPAAVSSNKVVEKKEGSGAPKGKKNVLKTSRTSKKKSSRPIAMQEEDGASPKKKKTVLLAA